MQDSTGRELASGLIQTFPARTVDLLPSGGRHTCIGLGLVDSVHSGMAVPPNSCETPRGHSARRVERNETDGTPADSQGNVCNTVVVSTPVTAYRASVSTLEGTLRVPHWFLSTQGRLCRAAQAVDVRDRDTF